MHYLKSLWRYRSFIVSFVQRDFQVKYTNSLFGFVWNILNPLSMIVVYTVIFSQVMKARLPGIDNSFGYSIYLCAGVFTWGLFSEITTRSQGMFIDNANLLKKLKFPKICLPISIIISSLVNFLIVFVLFALFLIISGNFPGFAILSILPIYALLIWFSASLGLLLGISNVFFRDVGQAFGIIITFWFWLTPIVYAPTILPSWMKSIINLNPMTPLIASIQNIFVTNTAPQWPMLGSPLAWSIIISLITLKLYNKTSKEIIDEL